MKKIKLIYLFLAMFVSLNGFVACDKINESDYLKPIGDRDWLGQRILIEDFTGMLCPNCPDAAAIADTLQSLYPEAVIVIANHVFTDYNPTNGSPDTLTCKAGDDYYKTYASGAALPTGMINRQTSQAASKLFGRGEWANEVFKLLNQMPAFTLEMNNKFDVKSKALKVGVTATPTKNLNGSYKLVVVITESNIIGQQKMPKGLVPNYNFRHVLRESITPSAGVDFLSGEILKDVAISKQFNFTIPERWNRGGLAVPANCSVVAFITDSSNGNIIQVAEALVIN